MKFITTLCSMLFGLTVANHVVVSLGSSYASGYGLKQSYGSILADYLEESDGAPTSYIQGAFPGSLLTDIPSQATNITQNTTIVTLTSGGNDLDYVLCLFRPSLGVCRSPIINATTYATRFHTALDAIIQNLHAAGVERPTDVPIYIVTYPQALGLDTVCAPNNTACPLTPAQVQQDTALYDAVTDWTLRAFHAYRTRHPGYDLRAIDTRPRSARHAIGAPRPWVNGNASRAAQHDGAAFHPNQAGVAAIARYLLADLGLSATCATAEVSG